MRNVLAVAVCAIASLLFLHAGDSTATPSTNPTASKFDYGDTTHAEATPISSSGPVGSAMPVINSDESLAAADNSAFSDVPPADAPTGEPFASTAPGQPSAFQPTPAAPVQAPPKAGVPTPVGSVFPGSQPSAFDPPPVVNSGAPSCSGPGKQQAGPQPVYYYQSRRSARRNR